MPSPITGSPVPDEVWESVWAEFALPALEQGKLGSPNSWRTRPRWCSSSSGSTSVMGTYCPVFQFLGCVSRSGL